MNQRLFGGLWIGLAFVLTSVGQGTDAVPAPGGAATLTPENTKIEFVCAHVGPKPDPRKGGFKAFTGKAVVDGKALKSIGVDIDTTSLFTQFDMLTTHLKSPDF